MLRFRHALTRLALLLAIGLGLIRGARVLAILALAVSSVSLVHAAQQVGEVAPIADCGSATTPALQAPASAELGTNFALCAVGFAVNQDLTLRTTRPDGEVRTAVLPTDARGTAQSLWSAVPEDPLGRYDVSATDGISSASASFSILAATVPHLLVVPPFAAPGTTFRVVAVGWPSSTSEVQATVYRRSGETWQPVDANRTLYTGSRADNSLWNTADQPLGTYLVQTNGSPRVSALYELRAPSVATSAPATEHALKRRDIPPGGVAAQLYFGAGAGNAPPCVVQEDQARRLHPATDSQWCSAPVGDDFWLELQGFAPNRDVSIEVRLPDGTVELHAVGPQSEGVDSGHDESVDPYAMHLQWQRPPLPGAPIGDYTVEVRQGALHAAGTFTVRSAAEPSLRVVKDRVSAGEPVQAVFAGLAPGQRPAVRLYRMDFNGFSTYLTTLDPGAATDRGELLWSVPTERDDLEVRYVLQPDITVKNFWLDRSFEPRRLIARPTVIDYGPMRDMAIATIAAADRAWARAVSREGAPLTDLDAFLGGAWLEEVRGSVARVRASGGFRDARLTALSVPTVQWLPDGRLEAIAREFWTDQLFAADGSLSRDLSGTLEQRYVFERIADAWLITESQLTRR